MANIHYRKGDIFESTTQVIVNTVNCKGVMGKGLALAFKQRYPEMFPIYQQECKTGKLRIGRPTLYRASTPWILNFPTKDNWKANSKLEYLEKGLEYFAANYKDAGIQSISFPKLGAQNGKLSWDEVGPLMAKYLSKLDIDVYIYIAEGDTEYYNDADSDRYMEEAIWKHFSELALSPDHLVQEVSLSPRAAKKVSTQRQLAEFRSLSDIDVIEGLGKSNLKKIKSYLHNQRYTTPRLPNMEDKCEPVFPKKKKPLSPKRKRKKASDPTDDSRRNLWPVET